MQSMAASTTIPTWTLGERIRKARESSGLKQSDLAPKLRVSRTAIAGWESGTHRPSYSALVLLADITGVPVEWIETGEIAGDTGPVTRGYPGQLSFDDAVDQVERRQPVAA